MGAFEDMEQRYLNPDIKHYTDYTTAAQNLFCDFCGEAIREGEEYLHHNGTMLCDGCLDDMSAKLLMEILRLEMEVA